MSSLIKPIEKYKIGDSETIRHKITKDDVNQFAKLTGDYNPLHLDNDFADRTSLKKPVVYGMLSASFISTIIGMKIPGPGALWTSQTLEFRQQVYIGDELTITAVVKQVSISTQTLILDIFTYNQNGSEVLKGEAVVKILQLQEEVKQEVENKANKVCLITGGTNGIGEGLAKQLVKLGYSIAINYRSSDLKAEYVYRTIKESGGQINIYKADISDSDQVKEMLREIYNDFGQITSVVHCACPPNNIKKFSQLEWKDIQKHIDVQLKGAYNCMQYILDRMTQNKIQGRIVFIGSIAADDMPPTLQTDYIIAKSALSSFAKSLAVEYGPLGIAINIVAPGMTETERIANMPEKAKLITKMHSPSRHLIQVKEVVKAIEFLLEQDSCAITGETIRVCGGTRML